MHSLTQEDIYRLPIHDSIFLGYKVFKDKDDFTEMALSFCFCDGEYENLEWDNSEPEKNASFLIQGCLQIHSKMICDSLPPTDAIDYIEIATESSLLGAYSDNSLKHIKIIFISGSQIECVAKTILFQFGSLI